MSVNDAALTPARPARPKVKDGVAGQVGAPMPGRVVGVSVDPGQAVARGDPLVGIEAMKMETTVFAEQAGVVAEVLVEPGAQVEAKDLLAVLGIEGVDAALDAPEARAANAE